MKKNLVRVFALALTCALILTGCGKTAQTNEPAEEPAASNPILTYAIGSDTGNTLNPLTADDRYGLMTCHLLYSPLYYIYPDGTIDYILAESFTPSEDGLEYTLKLKDGLKWSDDTPITADDIIFTYEKYNEQSENLFVGGKPIEMEKVDDLTVIFKLPSVSASTMELLSAEISIVPKHVFESRNSFDMNMLEEKIVSSGAYLLDEYKTGQYLKFVANPNYANGAPKVETIIFKIAENNDTASLALQNGEIDVWVGLPDLLTPFQDNENFNIYNYSEGRVAYMRLNSASPNMQDKQYREGILYAMDRSEIMLAAYSDENFYKLSYSFLPPSNQYYSEDLQKWDQDLDKAKELTANGSKTLKLCHIAEDAVQTNQALTIQKELADIGITVELVGVNQAAYMKVAYDKTNTEYDIYLGGYVMGVDPEVFSTLFVTGKDNWIAYNNKTVDELFAQGNATLDPAEREGIYNELQKVISEEAIFYPFGSNLRTLVTTARVDGVDAAQLVPIYTFGDWSQLGLK